MVLEYLIEFLSIGNPVKKGLHPQENGKIDMTPSLLKLKHQLGRGMLNTVSPEKYVTKIFCYLLMVVCNHPQKKKRWDVFFVVHSR